MPDVSRTMNLDGFVEYGLIQLVDGNGAIDIFPLLEILIGWLIVDGFILITMDRCGDRVSQHIYESMPLFSESFRIIYVL